MLTRHRRRLYSNAPTAAMIAHPPENGGAEMADANQTAVTSPHWGSKVVIKCDGEEIRVADPSGQVSWHTLGEHPDIRRNEPDPAHGAGSPAPEMSRPRLRADVRR